MKNIENFNQSSQVYIARFEAPQNIVIKALVYNNILKFISSEKKKK